MSEILAVLRAATRTLRSILGVPDYERYVAHCQALHPDVPPMSRDQFLMDVLERKYSRPGNRCC